MQIQVMAELHILVTDFCRTLYSERLTTQLVLYRRELNLSTDALRAHSSAWKSQGLASKSKSKKFYI